MGEKNAGADVDLTWFKFLGGHETAPMTKRNTKQSLVSRASARMSKSRSHRTRSTASTSVSSARSAQPQPVDLTYFKFLGGKEAKKGLKSRISSRMSRSKTSGSHKSSHKSNSSRHRSGSSRNHRSDSSRSHRSDSSRNHRSGSTRSHRSGSSRKHNSKRQPVNSAAPDQNVDLTYFHFLGGHDKDDAIPQVEVVPVREPKRSLSARLSARLSRPTSMEAIPEDHNVPSVERPPVRNISNNPHAVDLTYFVFLGGIVDATNAKKPASKGFKIPGILKGASSSAGDRKSLRKSLMPSERPHISSAGSAVSAATSGIVSLIRKARKSVFQVNESSATHITALRQEHTKIEDLMLVEHFASWFTTLTGEEVRPDHFCEDLGDGVVLCEVMKKIPGTKLTKYFSKQELLRMTEFRKRENIQKFAKACKSIGIHTTPTYADFKEKSVHNVVPVLVELVTVIAKKGYEIGDSMPDELRR